MRSRRSDSVILTAFLVTFRDFSYIFSDLELCEFHRKGASEYGTRILLILFKVIRWWFSDGIGEVDSGTG